MSVLLTLPEMDELMRELNQMDEAVRKTALTAMLEAGTEVVAAGIGSVAPRSSSPRGPSGKQTWRTGRHAADEVKRSKPKIETFSASATVGWDTKAGGKGRPDPHFYMKFIEFGTSRKAARPFMEFGLEKSEEEVFITMENVLLEELNRNG